MPISTHTHARACSLVRLARLFLSACSCPLVRLSACSLVRLFACSPVRLPALLICLALSLSLSCCGPCFQASKIACNRCGKPRPPNPVAVGMGPENGEPMPMHAYSASQCTTCTMLARLMIFFEMPILLGNAL